MAQTGYAVDTIANLKALPTTNLTYGFQLTIKVKRRPYQYEPASTAAADDEAVIEPDSGVGRWVALAAVSSGAGSGGGGGDVTALQAQVDEHTSQLQNLNSSDSYQASLITGLQNADSAIYDQINYVESNLYDQINSRVQAERLKDALTNILYFRECITLSSGSYDSASNTTSFFAIPYDPSPGSEPEWIVTGLIRLTAPITQLQIPEIPYTVDQFGSAAYKITLPGAVSNFTIRAVFDRTFETEDRSTFAAAAYDNSGGS